MRKYHRPIILSIYQIPTVVMGSISSLILIFSFEKSGKFAAMFIILFLIISSLVAIISEMRFLSKKRVFKMLYLYLPVLLFKQNWVSPFNLLGKGDPNTNILNSEKRETQNEVNQFSKLADLVVFAFLAFFSSVMLSVIQIIYPTT